MLEGEAELGQMIRERGREYGASTGRPRRCGWFDAFATRYAAEINGFTSVALTKLDVLDTLDEIKVCTGYKLNGKLCESLPAVSQDLRRVEPVYATLAGLEEFNAGHDGDEFPSHQRASLRRFSLSNRSASRSASSPPARNASQTIIVHDSAVGWLDCKSKVQCAMSISAKGTKPTKCFIQVCVYGKLSGALLSVRTVFGQFGTV